MKKLRKAKKSYVSEACNTVGVSVTVFYTARTRFRDGKKLTKNELDVLSVYSDLKEEERRKLEKLKDVQL